MEDTIKMGTSMHDFTQRVGVYMEEAEKDPHTLSNTIAYEIIGMMMAGYDKSEILGMFNEAIDNWMERVKDGFIDGLKLDETLLKDIAVNDSTEQSNEEKLKAINDIDSLIVVKTLMDFLAYKENENEDNQAKESN